MVEYKGLIIRILTCFQLTGKLSRDSKLQIQAIGNTAHPPFSNLKLPVPNQIF